MLLVLVVLGFLSRDVSLFWLTSTQLTPVLVYVADSLTHSSATSATFVHMYALAYILTLRINQSVSNQIQFQAQKRRSVG